jgi:catechol 2,3-dioxygenase-like lactoylglutathione lyase family enzyme
VPEFDVFDLDKSIQFWRDVLGFRIAYERPESGFAYLERGRAQVMLNCRNGNWETGPLERPLGRGINFMDSLEPLLASLGAVG